MLITFLTNEDENRILGAANAEKVLFTPQLLTEEEKLQARENIGAVSAEEVAMSRQKTYQKIATITAQANADGSLQKHVIFSVDSNGNPFQLTDFIVKAYAGFVDGGKSTLYMNINGSPVIANGVIGSIATACRCFNIFFRQEDSGFKRVEYTESMISDSYYNPQAAIGGSRLIPPMSAIADAPITNIDLYTETGDTKAWIEGSTFELWGVRA